MNTLELAPHQSSWPEDIGGPLHILGHVAIGVVLVVGAVIFVIQTVTASKHRYTDVADDWRRFFTGDGSQYVARVQITFVVGAAMCLFVAVVLFATA
jgi:hypothetical protein